MPHFQNSFQTLPKFFYEVVEPTPLLRPKLIHVTKLKETLGLDLSDVELTQWLNGEKHLPGEERISTRYAGHQFGVWAGQLGDGRAISVGEILTPEGRLEVQTKGSGLTPFSRMGDGKAVIRSSVREYLCSEAMFGLGIPTSRVLALLTGEDPVQRETIERSALVARVFPSNLRFGHFEMGFHFKKKDDLMALMDYARNTFFDGASHEDMLTTVMERTGKLIARWQSVGFCHGVMNTDNMSLLGFTIDYGPFGFMEDMVLGYVCNHSDDSGRYAYNEQPSIGLWNLEKLFICFLDVVPREKLSEILNRYPAVFEKEYLRLSRQKLGLMVEHETDYSFLVKTLQLLSQLSFDYTFFFRQLSRYQKRTPDSLKELWDYYGNRQELRDWLKVYDERLDLEPRSDEDRSTAMLLANPKYVLRNYIAQEVIDDVEAGNSDKLQRWLDILYRPFDEHPDAATYARPTPPEFKDYEVSCSS